METFLHYLPMANLLLFFLAFVSIAVWAFRPGAKKELQNLAHIPLKEDIHG